MKFTDIFIHRPVLATVVSLLILILGLRAATELTVRQYPELQNAVVSVRTVYVGAGADLVQGFITTPLEREIAQVTGIDYLASTSVQGASTIQAYLRLDKDANEALAEILTKVSKLRSELPEGSEDSVVELAEARGTAAAYLTFYSEVLEPTQVTDLLARTVRPELSAIPGMQKSDILGGGEFAMRVWLKPERLNAFNVTASEVLDALRGNNVLSAVGTAKGHYIKVPLTAGTDLNTVEDFRGLVVRAQGDAIVRLGDVANVVLGAETYDVKTKFNATSTTFMSVEAAPDANVIEVVKAVRELWPSIQARMPEGVTAEIAYDSTVYIQDAITEVEKTLIEAILIVIVVIFLFLGSARSVIIPAVTVPLSLVGALFLMLVLGYSINLLTLLAMVLAIGMVVDDAIIVLENVHRHIEEGLKPHDAAIKGARELVGPVIAMTLTLVAVYLPIGFQGGLTGKLFVEFAFTLAGAVLLSGVIALTLTPMMCARLLKPHGDGSGGLAAWLDRRFERLRLSYQRALHGALETKGVIAIFGATVLASCYFLFVATPSELAPEENTGFFGAQLTADGYASIETLERYSDEYSRIARSLPEARFTFELLGVLGANTTFTGTVLKPWSEIDRTTRQALNEVQAQVSSIPGVNVAVFAPPSLPTAGQGFPVEFVVKTTRPQNELAEVVNQLLGRAYASKKFIFIDSNLKIDQPQVRIDIDRSKAATLGIDMRGLGSDLSALLSGGYVNRFALENRSYKVIPQIERAERLRPEDLENYYTRAADGTLVPLSTLISLTERVQPQQLNRFQQLNAATLSGVQRPGVPLDEALGALEQAAAELLPPGFGIDYGGPSRQYRKEGSALVATFVFALILIYLVLAAQFESFRDPLIMLVTVPMSICGALFFLNLLGMFRIPGASLNIYTQVGLVTLIGVISKHGILIVEFANKLQKQGLPKRRAIEEAASIRLRPVLMTTAALVIAMVPLLLASGPGGSARFAMGLVIASGMTVGTLFTLYVVPAMYLYIGRDELRRQQAAGAAPVRIATG